VWGDPLADNRPKRGGQCETDGCKKERWARGMCPMHYRRWRLHGDPHHDRSQVRLLASIDVRAPDECWPWTGPIGEHGYGATTLKRRNMLASRAVYIAFVGDPGDLTVDHLCHKPEECPGGKACPHRRCVNPSHLGLETRVGNAMRGNSVWAINARKTHCSKGHEFTPENTRMERGSRVCVACKRKAGREREYRRRAGRPSAKIRAWAKAQGYTIGDSGRIPVNVIQRYAEMQR
jgi:hypothetical protein